MATNYTNLHGALLNFLIDLQNLPTIQGKAFLIHTFCENLPKEQVCKPLISFLQKNAQGIKNKDSEVFKIVSKSENPLYKNVVEIINSLHTLWPNISDCDRVHIWEHLNHLTKFI